MTADSTGPPHPAAARGGLLLPHAERSLAPPHDPAFVEGDEGGVGNLLHQRLEHLGGHRLLDIRSLRHLQAHASGDGRGHSLGRDDGARWVINDSCGLAGNHGLLGLGDEEDAGRLGVAHLGVDWDVGRMLGFGGGPFATISGHGDRVLNFAKHKECINFS